MGTETAASRPEVIVTITVIVTATMETTVVVGTGIVCNVYVMAPSKCRSIVIIAKDRTGRIGHIVLEIAISMIISQGIYESIRRVNVTSGI